MKHIDVQLGTYAAEHYGVVALRELVALGVRPRQVTERLGDGRLVSLHEAVYRVVGAPWCWEGEARAALLAAGPNSYACGHTAMRLMGIRGVWDDTIELTHVGRRLPLLDGVRVHRIDRLDPIDTYPRLGLPCLAPPVALLTLGARATGRQVHNAVHDALKLRITTRARLYEVLDRLGGRGRRGTVKFRNALKALPASGVSETGFELDLYRLMLAGGWSPEDLELQHEIIDGDGRRRRADIAIVDAHVDLEANGDRWHDPVSDAIRTDALRRVGWHVEAFTEDDIHVYAGRTLRRIREVVEARRRSLSANNGDAALSRQRTGGDGASRGR